MDKLLAPLRMIWSFITCIPTMDHLTTIGARNGLVAAGSHSNVCGANKMGEDATGEMICI